MPQEPPADDVLLELGRLIWAAIKLEDVVYTVCRSIEPRHGPWDDCPIGQHINEALADLGHRPNDELRAAAERWLATAKTVLEERNAVVHAVPTAFMTMQGEQGETELVSFPRDKTRSAVRTPLTVDGLAPIRHRLMEARDGWVELAPELWARRGEAARD